MEIKKFENKMIAFDFDNDVVNATDMIKAYPNKRINDFLSNQQTKDFIEVLERNLITGIPVIKSQVGRYGGTYMHKRLALKFASWLNPEFENFVYEVFESFINEKIKSQQRQLDYFWDKSDQKDLYP